VSCFLELQMPDKKLLAEMYRQIYAIRTFEHRCIKLYRLGKIRGYFHPYLGEEAIAVGVCAALRKQDNIISTHRGHGHCIARGASIKRMVAELLGKDTGYCKGRGGSMHIADLDTGNMGANGIVGGGVPIGVGAGLSAYLRGEDRVSVIFCSDGAANNGVFAESMNLAAIWNLPVILALENNHYAVSTPIEAVSRNPDLYVRSQGYGIESSKVDGNDVLAVYERTRAAVQRCVAGKGPVVIEAKTYRHMGHHVNDPGTYMPKDKLDYWKSRDPLDIGRKYLLEKASAEDIKAIEESVDREIEEAVAFAEQSPEPGVAEFLGAIAAY
jgi:pyruvate dehydrogenase E1 component alpha subunit